MTIFGLFTRAIIWFIVNLRLISNSSRIFIAMLHLYGTRGDTKIWAKIISAHAKKCSRMEVSVAEGRWVGRKRGAL